MSKRTKYLLGIGVIATLVVGFQVAAFAIHLDAFELDGDANDNTSIARDDWANVCKDENADPLCASAANTSAFGGADDTAFVTETQRAESVFTGGGSKDESDIPAWLYKGDGGLPDKDNLLHSYAALYTVPATGDELLYFGADRFDNSGDAALGFWFFQSPVALNPNNPPANDAGGFTGNHTEGDLLVISNFSNGGQVSDIFAYTWDPACGDTKPIVNDPGPNDCAANNLQLELEATNATCPPQGQDDACAIVNTGTITMPWKFDDKTTKGAGAAANSALKSEFFEGGIDLGAVGLADACFATALAETRSSTSTDAVLKDFTLGAFGDCNSGVTTQSTPTGSVSIGTGQNDSGKVTTSDSATVNVTGANIWQGKVQFYLCGPDLASPPTITTCAANAQNAIGSPVSVSNTTPTVTSPGTTTVTSAGKYCWSATFTSETSGVPNGTDDGTNECFTVTPVTPALDTQAVASPVTFGQPVQDNATLNGTANQPGTPVINPTTAGAAAGGKIIFTLLKNDCTTLATGTGSNPQEVTVNGNGTYGPVSFTPDAPGTYHWKAQYVPATGDPNNLGSTHNGSCNDTDETVVVNQQNSTISSTQEWVPNDTATVNHAGTVTFTLLKNVTDAQACSGGSVIYGPDTKTLSGSGSTFTASSSNATKVTSVAAGDEYRWKIEVPATGSFKAVTSCVEATKFTSLDNGGTVTSQ